jgi:light-regulated signal transduction histidine kinase (bacteriophytochrome)
MKGSSVLDTVITGGQIGYARLRNPGFTQSFGVMIVLHPRTLRILAASENIEAVLGVAHAQAIGQLLSSFIDKSAAEEIRAGMVEESPNFQNPIPAIIQGRRADAILHFHDGLIILEVEPRAPGAPARSDLDRLGQAAIEGMILPQDMAALLNAAPEAIRSATQFDRVLLYRFDEAYRGQVVAEARRPGVDSFLGLFFPESDIGAPARALYEQNFSRYIADVSATQVRLIPGDNPLTGRPIDMSLATLRGVAPCHTEYLSNMGVAASMSFSILSEGRLWGLLACHHYEAARLSFTQRLVCEQIAMLFTARLTDLVNPAAVEEDMARRRASVIATSPVLRSDPIGQDWTLQDETDLLALVKADGVAVYEDGRVGQIGLCPDLSPLHAHLHSDPDALDRLIRVYDEDGLFYTNSATATAPFGAEMRELGSGMMIIPLSRKARRYLIWFRPEQVLKASWAGDPSMRCANNPTARFTPRKSFEIWKEDIQNRSAPWEKLEIENAVALRNAALTQADW